MSRLSESRSRFDSQWQRLRRSLRREVGTEPRWSPQLVLTLLALAGGVLLGVTLRERRWHARGGRRPQDKSSADSGREASRRR